MGTPSFVPEKNPKPRSDAEMLADFVILTQWKVMLNLSSEFNKSNVSFSQFFLLNYLANEEYTTITDIAKRIGHSTSAATEVVDKLEKLWLVERIHSTADRRKIHVQVTKKGIDFIAEMKTKIGEELHRMLQEQRTD